MGVLQRDEVGVVRQLLGPISGLGVGWGLNMRALLGAGDWLPGARARRSYDTLLLSP